MNRLATLTGLSVLVLSFALISTVAAPETAYAQNDRDAASENENAQRPAQNDTVYEYTAQEGDSYSLLARKAVQTYGLKEKVNLTLAQILYAETNLTIAANSPELNEGQKVTVKEADVKSWVDKAKTLSPTAQTAWDYYVQFADFNTDNVGESRS